MSKSDPRCVAGALVHAKAVHVTSSIECHHRYGSLAKTTLVNGVVTKVETVPSSTNKRSVTLITADYSLGGDTTKSYVMNSRNVKAGHVAAVPNEGNGLVTESGIQNSTTTTTTNDGGTAPGGEIIMNELLRTLEDKSSSDDHVVEVSKT
jgi:hypothetical protein